MSANPPHGAIKKQPKIRKTVRIQKEMKPNEFAIPTHVECLGEPSYARNFATPQFNTVLGIKEEMERIQSLKLLHLTNTTDLTPRSKSAVMPKINQRLNIDVNQPVFKNLPPLNVNDSILLPKESQCIRKKYKFNSNKPPAPELCDFLDPLPALTHVIEIPEIKLEFPEQRYDFLAAYNRYKEDCS